MPEQPITLTAEKRIKRELILSVLNEHPDADQAKFPTTTPWEIDASYLNMDGDEDLGDGLRDHEADFRSSGEGSSLPDRASSRHYDCDEVARKLSDGTWVGWTYWYGGGKHGEPDAIDWLGKAYDVHCEVVTRPVNVFSIPAPAETK